jgi:hypothetical protein
MSIEINPPLRQNAGLKFTRTESRQAVVMPQSREILERLQTVAKQRRDACASQFKQAGVEEKALKKQPAWRNADAECRQLARRLRAVSAKEKLQADKASRGESAAAE